MKAPVRSLCFEARSRSAWLNRHSRGIFASTLALLAAALSCHGMSSTSVSLYFASPYEEKS